MKIIFPYFLTITLNALCDVVATINSLTANVTNATVNPSMVGEWKEVKKTTVVAMYIVLARPTKILIIDKGKSRTLNLKTNVFCSARSFFENGTLIESGGAENALGAQKGFQSARLFTSAIMIIVIEPFGDFNTGRLMGDYIHMPDGKVLVLVWVMLVGIRYYVEIFTPPYLLKGISQPIIRNIVDTTLQLLNTDSNKIWCGSHHID
ncbi:galactose oxidase [Gigaspora margarita]|uniref:Galactose oxidase n=1 Tax=Gigaspora margarita TaxID=4874 RepID=A0A8H3X2B7_GIGMA|nr:galactose oxidase [Gigaspora margarita]